jgi:hypothetical protein
MNKPGRNDPCPCGSGKKYKHCCLGANNILPFPDKHGGFGDMDFEGYDDFIRRWDGPGDPPTYNEWRERPNMATGLIHEIKKEIGDRVFSTMEELREFADEFNYTQAAQPISDFLGLSPETMHKMMNHTTSR